MKTSGSSLSLMQGVSQQVPQNRGPGQHTEQVNMIPDPVQGLSRRHGSVFVAEAALGITEADLPSMIADTDNWCSFEYSNNNHDYVVLYRTAAKPVSSPLNPVIVYDRTDKQYLNYVRPVTDTVLDSLESGGVSAITSIGKYVFMAGHSIVPTGTQTDLWGNATNQANAVVWIRGGAYARTFEVTATKTDDTQVTFSYKTPTSSYPEVLDTTGVAPYAKDPAGGTQHDHETAYVHLVGTDYVHELLWKDYNPTGLTVLKAGVLMTNVSPAAPANNMQYSYVAGADTVYFHSSAEGRTDYTVSYTHDKVITNPNYAPLVSEITNAYNSAVTKWIGDAAEAIQPENIAQSLLDAAAAVGLVGTRQASTLIFTNVKGLTVNDGGDGSLIRGVANEVTNIDQLSTIHLVGKVVKIRARNAEEVLYMKATAKDPAITSGYTEVTWVEGAGVEQTIDSALVYGTAAGGNFYMASSATLLNSIIPGTHPEFTKSTAGDLESSPIPFFIGKKITYLGVFQDRLLIGAGAVLRCSRTGDYLTMFRSSVVTVPADDPLEMLSQGSEDDVLRYSVLYDKDLVIFGDKRQYVVSGRVVLSPTNPNMPVQSSHANAAQVQPLSVGSVIFYGQVGTTSSSMHQIEPGPVNETTESFNVSTQIDTYLSGRVIEIANHTKPTHVFVRTTGKRSSLYCFTYLDKRGEGRVQDAWHRWDFNPSLGVIIGMSRTAEGLLVHFLRNSGGNLWVVADLCPLTTGLAETPYLDSQRYLADISGSVTEDSVDDQLIVAFDSSSAYRFIGDLFVNREALMLEFPDATGPMTGFIQDAYFTPTNPFVHDRNNKAITSGRLTITKKIIGCSDSSGFTAEVAARGTVATYQFTGRIVGNEDNLVGIEPVSDINQSVPIGLEIRDYTLTLRAHTWLPLTITSIEWVGQWFNRTQRF